MSYIVRNCPCIKHFDEIELDNRCMSTQDDKLFFCENNTDCVIKQVIDKCKERSGKCERCQASEDYQPTDCLDYCSNDDDVVFADDILQLFDIEEVEK